MKFILRLAFSIFLLFLTGEVFGQEKKPVAKYAIRLTFAPQASYFSPHEYRFSDEEKNRWAGYSFGAEASKWISPNWDISMGYYFSRQVGNTNRFDCLRVGPNPCPQSRGRVNFMKVPFSFGWYFAQHKKYSSKLALGPQIQLLFNDPSFGRPDYKTASLGMVGEWVNYIVLNQHLDIVASIRFDHAITNVDEGSEASRIKSLGLHLGFNYNL